MLKPVIVGLPDIPWLVEASRRRKWLLGVSGGADSVALLHLLHDSGFRNLVVCHLHHGLRGADADGDERFVRRLARRLGHTFDGERVDIAARMRETGKSMETAARDERLAFFARASRRHRCCRVLLAHHADDQAETVLWNLARGAHGLRGMREEQQLEVYGTGLVLVRPLLHMRHRVLVDWLEKGGRSWREDASNRLPVAVRNRFRNEVLPLLEEITGRDPVAGLVRLADDFAEWHGLLSDMARDRGVLDPQGRIHLGVLRSLPPVLQRLAIVEFLKENGIPDLSRPLVDSVLAMLPPEAAASVNLPGGGRLRRSRGRFWIDR